MFWVIKRQFGQMKKRYRGFAKNQAHLIALFAIGNLFRVRRRLISYCRVCPQLLFPFGGQIQCRNC